METKHIEVRNRIDNFLKESQEARSARKERLKTYFAEDEETLITYEDLLTYEVGERIEVNEAVTFEKIYQDANRMTFLTHMLDGGGFGMHKHNCYEVTKILKGNLFERSKTGLRVYTEGEEIIYGKNELHKPYATMDSTYEVTFLRKLF